MPRIFAEIVSKYKNKRRELSFFVTAAALVALPLLITLPMIGSNGLAPTGYVADIVLGQDSLNFGLISLGISPITLNNPSGVSAASNKVFLADKWNNRVLVYNGIPSVNNSSAEVVLGQPEMFSNLFNNGGISAKSLGDPTGVFCDGTRLFIADSANNRVLVFNSIPVSSFASADIVLGQPDMNTGTAGLSAKKMNYPTAVFYDGKRVYVADTGNNRVLIYNSVPVSNDANADVVLGQPGFILGQPNNGESVSASVLNAPTGLCSDSQRLYISDSGNNRVLVFKSIPELSFAPADLVIGQPDMMTAAMNSTNVSANTLNNPRSVILDGNRLFVTDSGNNRVLVYTDVKTTNPTAEAVIGQPSFTSSEANNGGVSGKTLSNPEGVAFFSDKLFISDKSNHRLLAYNMSLFKAGAAAGSSTMQIVGLAFDGQNFKRGDTIGQQPELSAILFDAEYNPVQAASVKVIFSPVDSSAGLNTVVYQAGDSYDVKTGQLKFKLSEKIAQGVYNIKIEALAPSSQALCWVAKSIDFKKGDEKKEVSGNILNFSKSFIPKKESAKIAYLLNSDGDVTLYIFDENAGMCFNKDYLSGKEGGKTGFNQIQWDGKRNSGDYIDAGVFSFKLISGSNVIGSGSLRSESGKKVASAGGKKKK